MRIRAIASLVVAVAAAALWIVNCSGPRPEVAGVRLVEPATEDAPYRVEITLRNTGSGHGQTTLNVRLRDQTTGHTVEQEEHVTLDRGETADVVSEILAPRGRYVPDVTAEYPPR